MEKKPEVNGKAASARAPIVSSAAVNGSDLRKPPILSMFWLFAIAAITEPAAMNSSALKKAWVMRWKSPAE